MLFTSVIIALATVGPAFAAPLPGNSNLALNHSRGLGFKSHDSANRLARRQVPGAGGDGPATGGDDQGSIIGEIIDNIIEQVGDQQPVSDGGASNGETGQNGDAEPVDDDKTVKVIGAILDGIF